MTGRLRPHHDGRILYYDAWRNIPSHVLRSKIELAKVIIGDLSENDLDISQIKNYKWIIDLKPEGIDATDIRPLYEYLCEDQGLSAENFRVIFSCVQDVTVLPYLAKCLPDRLIYNGNWYMHLKHFNVDWVNMPMTHKLVCLMRRPSIGRGNLAKRILAKFRYEDLIMSFGTNGEHCDESVKKLVWPHPFPMIVDRPMADQVFQHRIDHDFFYRAPINLVVESSSQIDPNTWRSIFITEKTFKALAWYQFPVWYAVPGLVREVRCMGFDVFDDLFDGHAYDLIEDPWIRMTQVVQLIHRVSQQDMAALRQQYWNRLQSNARLIDYIHDTAIVRHTQTLDEFSHA